MDPLTIAAIVTAVASTGNAVIQKQNADEQYELQEKKAGVENARAELRARRSRNRLISQARQAMAQQVVSGEAKGTGGGSSQAGAMGGTLNNANTAIGDQRGIFQANAGLAAAQNRAAGRMNKRAGYSALFNVAQGFAGTEKQVVSWQKMFKDQ